MQYKTNVNDKPIVALMKSVPTKLNLQLFLIKKKKRKEKK